MQFSHLASHRGEDPRFDLPGCERRDEGDELAVPGDEGRLPGLLDQAHNAGCLLVKLPHGVDESLIAIHPQCGILHFHWRHVTPVSRTENYYYSTQGSSLSRSLSIDFPEIVDSLGRGWRVPSGLGRTGAWCWEKAHGLLSPRKWAAVSMPKTTGTGAIRSAETGSQLTYGWSEMVSTLEVS